MEESAPTYFEKENSFRTITRRIASFGSVQLFNILINLVRGKLVAIFLGPEGMGIMSLFTTSTNTIQQLATLGLGTPLVKEISSNRQEPDKLSHILAVSVRLTLVTALIGGILCLLLSPALSYWSFGDTSYTMSFILLSAAVVFSVAANGYLSILQGLGEVKRFVKTSIIGSSVGLVIGAPLYYFYGDAGIVPSLIILSLSVFLFNYISYWLAHKGERTRFTLGRHKELINRLLKLGFLLMIGSLAGSATNYALNVFVRYFGSIENVGLFQAANSLTNQYVGLIFGALAMDYFPRLSAAMKSTEKMNIVVNRQTEIVLLIATPLILLLLLTTPLVIELLLTDRFEVITPLMRWLGVGVLIQCFTFPLGYLYIAGENRKLYFWLEVVVANILWILCSFIFYYVFGLIGLGVGLVARTFIEIFLVYFSCNRFYGFRYDSTTLKIIVISLLMGLVGFSTTFLDNIYSYPLLSVILIISTIYSFKEIRARLSSRRNEDTD